MSFHDYRGSFNGGEISDLVDGQVALDKYQSACRTMRNWIARTYGPAFRRPGTLFVGEVKYSDRKTRLEGFSYSVGTTFVLEIGHYYIRFWSNDQQVTVGGVPVEVTTPWSEDEVFDLYMDAKVNDVIFIAHPDHEPRRLIRNSDTDWSLDTFPWTMPPMRDENVYEGLTIASSGTSGSVTLTANAPLWAGSTGYEVDDVRMTTGGQFIRCLVKHTSGGSVTADIAAGKWEEFDVFTPDNVGGWFALTHTREASYVSLTPPALGSSSSIKVLGDWTLFTYGTIDADINVERSYTGDFTGEEDVIYSAPLRGDRNLNYSATQEEAAWLRIDIPYYNVSSANPSVTLEAADASITGVVKVDTWISSTQVVGTVLSELESTNATDRWSESSWSPRRGWPRAAQFHEQRLLFGGNVDEPDTIWGSRIGDFYDFTLSILDSGAFAFALAAAKGHAINWMSSHQTLLVGTEGDEWALSGGSNDDVITPLNRRARRQSNSGSSYIPPVVANDAILFIQRTGHKLRELTFDFAVKDGWKPVDLTILADHIFRSAVVQTALQQQADTIVWAVREDGVLVGVTYERDQNVVAYHQHDTDGAFESVATVYGDGTEWDNTYVLVNRTINGQTKRYVEKLDPDFFTKLEMIDQDDMVYSDSALVCDHPSPVTTVTGLDHLEGKTVNVLGDGARQTQKVVSSGQITLDTASTKVVVGLDYESILKPTRVEVGFRDGSAQGRKFRANRVTVRVWRTLGLSLSRVDGGWDAFSFRDTEDPFGSPAPLYTGDVEMHIESAHDGDMPFSLRANGPLPANVVALITKFNVTGS